MPTDQIPSAPPACGIARRQRVVQKVRGSEFREGNHERTIREYRLTPRGIEIGEPLDKMQGVLTGVPTLLPEDALLGRTAKTQDGGT